MAAKVQTALFFFLQIGNLALICIEVPKLRRDSSHPEAIASAVS